MGKFFGEKTVLDLFMRNGVVPTDKFAAIIMEKIFSTILRKFKMGKCFGEKTVLDLFMRNGVV